MKIQELSSSERVILAQELWDSLKFEQATLEITEAQVAELDARLSRYELDGDPGSTWEEVKGRVLGS